MQINWTEERNLTMLTDYYEFTMSNGYFINGMKDKIAVFDMFFRNIPDGGGFAVFAGLEQMIHYLENLRFTQQDIEYFRSKKIFNEQFLDYLANFHFECDVWAMEEGTPIFPNEPIVTVKGPIIQAQLVETMILLTINHQSLVATKANRMVRAAGDKLIMEFGSRRAQGYDAAILGARATYIGGCGATACAITDRDYGVPAVGTMAHSWVQMFDSEYEAFRSYAEIYPDDCTLLIDTYNVLKSGIPNAIRVFQEMKDAGVKLHNYGIRMDSGDLAYLSKKVRQMLDAAGFPDAIISASNDLDEYLIETLKIQGAKITSWGVGTSLITSRDCPAFGGVYKLAAIRNEDGHFTPKIKLSENTEKVTNPGNKEIYRIYDKETGKIRADLICLANETFDENEDMVLFDPNETWKRTRIVGGTYTMRKLLVPIFEEGKCVYTSPSVMEIQSICTQEKATLWDENMRFVNPSNVYVDLSDNLYDLKQKVFNELSAAKYHIV